MTRTYSLRLGGTTGGSWPGDVFGGTAGALAEALGWAFFREFMGGLLPVGLAGGALLSSLAGFLVYPGSGIEPG